MLDLTGADRLAEFTKLTDNMVTEASKDGLEERADALLKRLQRHNLGNEPLTQFEIKSVLKEIQTIGKMNLAGSLPADVLTRIYWTMERAVQEANKLLAK